MGTLRVRTPILVTAIAVLLLTLWSTAARSLLSPQPAQAATAASYPLPTASDLAAARQASRHAAAVARRHRAAVAQHKAAVAARQARARAALHHQLLWVKSGQSVDIHSSPGGSVVATIGATDEFGAVSTFSVIERRGAWVGVSTRALENGQLGWIKLDSSSVGTGTTPWSVEVDLSKQRAELLHGDHIARSFTVAIGRSTSPTPTGRFSITDEIQSGLSPVYGCCALALSAHQPNLPAGWTGGDQIAIHGSPDNAVGGAISDGCIHATTADLEALISKLPLGAPVVIHG
ncbi:MAG: hypothetical protein QOJ01_2210 [Solirubrobacterales bacterium]|jgi:lipoprotein-anchoring transpeptidase ErfK/SrfK|nr:hypothetical protein [Solirubrobacterales bacterium]